METPCTIKHLIRGAISFLETSYCPQRPESIQRATINIFYPELFTLCQRELIALCESRDKTRMLLLANLVEQVVVEKRIPTLLVLGESSPAVFAVNLLLWRAGIKLEEAINPVWGESAFSRLTVAAGELANAPLLVMRKMPMLSFRNMAHAVVANQGTRWLVMDSAETESFGRLSKISCELGVPITITSSASVGGWRRASGKRSGRNGVE